MRLRANGYAGRLVSFEPYAEAFAQLRRTASHDPAWEAHRLALSDADGQAELNISTNSFSSSLLDLSERHLESAPDAAFVARDWVETRRLDGLWDEVVGSRRAWLKLDVQGFELPVLLGAGSRLDDARAVELELSLVPLYDGAADWRTMLEWLEERGFALAAVEPGFDDPQTGRLLQCDGIFVR